MVKIKKRYLLIAIVTIVAMLISGLSLILSANTNISASPNVNVTVKATGDPWDGWTVTKQGSLGNFGYQILEGEYDKAVIFTGTGALDLTYEAVCTTLGVENLNGHNLDDVIKECAWEDGEWYWERDYFLVVGEGITSVSMD